MSRRGSIRFVPMSTSTQSQAEGSLDLGQVNVDHFLYNADYYDDISCTIMCRPTTSGRNIREDHFDQNYTGYSFVSRDNAKIAYVGRIVLEEMESYYHYFYNMSNAQGCSVGSKQFNQFHTDMLHETLPVAKQLRKLLPNSSFQEATEGQSLPKTEVSTKNPKAAASDLLRETKSSTNETQMLFLLRSVAELAHTLGGAHRDTPEVHVAPHHSSIEGMGLLEKWRRLLKIATDFFESQCGGSFHQRSDMDAFDNTTVLETPYPVVTSCKYSLGHNIAELDTVLRCLGAQLSGCPPSHTVDQDSSAADLHTDPYGGNYNFLLSVKNGLVNYYASKLGLSFSPASTRVGRVQTGGVGRMTHQCDARLAELLLRDLASRRWDPENPSLPSTNVYREVAKLLRCAPSEGGKTARNVYGMLMSVCAELCSEFPDMPHFLLGDGCMLTCSVSLQSKSRMLLPPRDLLLKLMHRRVTAVADEVEYYNHKLVGKNGLLGVGGHAARVAALFHRDETLFHPSQHRSAGVQREAWHAAPFSSVFPNLRHIYYCHDDAARKVQQPTTENTALYSRSCSAAGQDEYSFKSARSRSTLAHRCDNAKQTRSLSSATDLHRKPVTYKNDTIEEYHAFRTKMERNKQKLLYHRTMYDVLTALCWRLGLAVINICVAAAVREVKAICNVLLPGLRAVKGCVHPQEPLSHLCQPHPMSQLNSMAPMMRLKPSYRIPPTQQVSATNLRWKWEFPGRSKTSECDEVHATNETGEAQTVEMLKDCYFDDNSLHSRDHSNDTHRSNPARY